MDIIAPMKSYIAYILLSIGWLTGISSTPTAAKQKKKPKEETPAHFSDLLVSSTSGLCLLGAAIFVYFYKKTKQITPNKRKSLNEHSSDIEFEIPTPGQDEKIEIFQKL